MKIVVDTSVIIAVITNELHKQALLNITEGAELCAPSSLHWEIGNAFSAMFKKNRVGLEQAKLSIREYQKIPVNFYDVSLSDVLDVSFKHKLYAYDAYFLVCARQLNVPLLSLDKSLLSHATDAGIKTLEV